jgi:glycosyltransferase involved in cell wall biosynthesis
LTVSRNSRVRIAATLRIPESSIDVIGEGPGDAFRPINDPGAVRSMLDRYRLPAAAPLVLYVGGISPHKNLDGLLQAFARLPENAHLAVVGDHAGDSFYGCYPQLLELRARLGLEPRVTFTGFVPDEDLALLYNAATVLALPSLDEGFGLPAVEAMACGLAVAASRSGAMPEVLGPAGVLFDPRDQADMAAALSRVLQDPKLRGDLSAEGQRRAALFTWSAAARDTVRLFERTAGPAAVGER